MDVRDLEDEMDADAIVIEYCKNEFIAAQFYQALCNNLWYPIRPSLPDDEEIMRRLKGEVPAYWDCSWRRAGGIIAGIRNINYNTHETYMDWYCSGNEGQISELVEECFERMGWRPEPS